jgi:endonuclease YncB( thermonuclease family)
VNLLTTLLALAASLPALSDPAAPPRPASWSADASGQIRVVEGGLLMLRGQPVRLDGIAVPSPAQRCQTMHGFSACGLTAAQVLRDVVGPGPVDCRIVGPDLTPWVRAKPQWRGICQVHGVDVAQALVQAGFAVPEPGSPYVQAGLEACASQHGIWAWSVESPWTFAARREGDDLRPLFIGALSGTPCLRAVEARWRR